MEHLIALGMLAGLIAAAALLFGWVYLMMTLAERMNWPIWLEATLAFMPALGIVYFALLAKVSAA